MCGSQFITTCAAAHHQIYVGDPTQPAQETGGEMDWTFVPVLFNNLIN